METIFLNGKWKCRPDLENLVLKIGSAFHTFMIIYPLSYLVFTRLIDYFMEYIEKKQDYLNR